MQEPPNQYRHEVVITAIVMRDGKYLITRRSPSKKRFPAKWSVPGGFQCEYMEHWNDLVRDFVRPCVREAWDASARLIEGFCERSETKDPMSGQFL